MNTNGHNTNGAEAPGLWGPERVCEYLGGISLRTLAKLIDEKHLPVIQPFGKRGKRFFRPGAVDEWIIKQEKHLSN